MRRLPLAAARQQETLATQAGAVPNMALRLTQAGPGRIARQGRGLGAGVTVEQRQGEHDAR